MTIPARLIRDENNALFAEISAEQACSGCHKASCQTKAHRFPVDARFKEGSVAVDIAIKDFALLLANSLGLPLMGLLLGAGIGRYWGMHEGFQLGLAVLGLGLGALSCRGYAQSMIRIRSSEEALCSP